MGNTKKIKKFINRNFQTGYSNSSSNIPSKAPYMGASAESKTNNKMQESLSAGQNDFMEQKMRQSDYFKCTNEIQESFNHGFLSGLLDNFQNICNSKDKIQKLTKQQKTYKKIIQTLSDDLGRELSKSAALKKDISKYKKQNKKLADKVDNMEKIIHSISIYMGIGDRDSSLDELAANWKHFAKNHKNY